MHVLWCILIMIVNYTCACVRDQLVCGSSLDMSGLVGPGTEIYYWPPLGRPHVYVNLNVPQVLC